jgi:FkbM family methyltransferase
MKNFFERILYCLTLSRLFLLLGNTRVSKHIAEEGIIIKKKNGQIQLPFLNIAIDRKKHFFILERISLICSLKKNAALILKVNDKNEIIADISGICFYINSKDEIFTLNEVFAQYVYGIIIPFKSIVIDVGMNIADSTLYFASKKEVERVYAYDPFISTYKSAIRNIELNPEFSAKIEPYNFGLGDKEEELVCNYSAAYKGSAGIWYNAQHTKNENVIKEKIKMMPVSDEVIRAKKRFPEHKLIMKVDCEGSEFEIIESLNKKNLLSQIDIILLEWHIKEPTVIINILLKAGFAIFSRDNIKNTYGMLYAFKI